MMMNMESMEMEGHLHWVRCELIPKSVKTDEELKDHCLKLLKENDKEESRGAWRNEWSTITAEKLNTAALLVLSGNKEKAELLLKELDELLEGKMDATKTQRGVILYCRDLLRWQIGGGEDSNEGMRLTKKWGILDDFGGNEVKAVIVYLKGSLKYKLKVRHISVQNYFFEAWDMDPKCLAWYHHSYRIARKIRRAKEGIDQAPNRMEKYFAKTAYQLCDGKNKVAAADYGLMLKDIFKKQNNRFWRDLHSAFVEVLEKELPSAQGDRLIKIRIHLAEFLYFGQGPVADQKRGREMFAELEQDYPRSFDVMHKVGNLYQTEKKLEQARDCYKRALELEPTAVPCILDYLQLLKCDKDQAEIVRVLQKALSPEYVTSEKDNAKLQRELELATRFSSKSYFKDCWELECDDDDVDIEDELDDY